MRRGPARLLSLPILLVLLLPLFAQPTAVRAASGTGTPPTPVAPTTAPASRPAAATTTAATSTRAPQSVGSEVVALRTATSRTYVDKHGLRAVISPRPINYRDSAGAFQPIDTRLAAAAGGGYTTRSNAFAVTLPADLGAGAVAVGTPAGPVAFALIGAKGAASISGATATYANALPGVTVADTATNDGLKETLTLASAAAPAGYTFALTLPAGVTARASAAGGLALVDGAGHPVAAFAAPTMHDAKGAAGRATLTLAAGRLTLTADPAWLASSARAYPVTIDPSVIVLPGAAQDCYLDSGSPTTAFCSTDDEVGVDNSTQRQLLQFNLAAIVGPVDVLSAKLTLQETASQATSPVNVELHPVTNSWTTATTWTTRDGSTAWASAGGDYGARPAWTTAVGPATGSYTWWLTALVNAWANGTVANTGLLLKAVSETPNTFLSFASSRDPNQANWPTLTVTYEPQVGERGFSPLLGFGLTDRMGLAVNVANGNLILHAHDVGIAGTGLPLVVDRLFNNLAGDVGDTNELGPGWVHTTGSDVWLDPTVAGDGVVYHGVGGYALFYQRNADGSYLTPPGEDATLIKNGDGSFTLTWHGSGERYQFDSLGNLTSDVDRNGNALRFTYNADTGTHTITDTQGRVLTFAYTNVSYPKVVTQLADWTGRTWQYAYDAGGNLVTSTDPAGKLTRYAYTTGDLTQITDPLGHVTALTYQQTNPERVTSITFGAGSPVAGTYTFTYNTGNTVVTDPNSHSTTYYYDGQGRQTKVVDALSNTFQWAWTSDNHVQTSTDAKGQVFTNVYDDTANPPTCSTQVGTHNLCSVQSPSSGQGVAGPKQSWSYTDGTHPFYPTSATDAQGNLVNAVYDASGNRTQVSGTATILVNNVPTPTRVQASAVYNSNGTVASSTDFNSNTTSYTYDGTGNLRQITPPAFTPGPGSQALAPVVIVPDALSRPATVTDGNGNITTNTYDLLDRVTLRAYQNGPQSASVATTPDADGNLKTMTDSTGTTQSQFDARNRQTQKTLPNSGYLAYGYDAASNLLSLIDAATVVGRAPLVTYHYNAGDELDWLQEPGVTNTVTFAYDANGARTGTTYPDGVRMAETLDNAGRVFDVTSTAPNATVLASFHYSFNTNPANPPAGRDTLLPTQVTAQQVYPNASTIASTTAMTYDGLNRLLDWKKTNTAGGALMSEFGYGHDPNGNKVQINATGTVTTYTFNAVNEMTKATGSSTFTDYYWDANGNQTGTGPNGVAANGQQATFNLLNQTASVTNTSRSPVALTYTGPGQTQRTAKGNTAFANSDLGLAGRADSTATVYYTRDPDGRLISERRTPPGGASTSYYPLLDAEGSIRALEDPGTIVDAYDYCPTGNVLTTTTQETVPNDQRYLGDQYDAEFSYNKTGAGYQDADQGHPTQLRPPLAAGLLAAPAIGEGAEALGGVVCVASGVCEAAAAAAGIAAVGIASYEAYQHRNDIADAIGNVAQFARSFGDFANGLQRLKPKAARPRFADPDKANKGGFYEYDPSHGGELERYDLRGNHIGVSDPNTGGQIKPPRPGRTSPP